MKKMRLEARFRELIEMVKKSLEAELSEARLREERVQLGCLINMIPAKTLLRFRGKERTVLIAKLSRTSIWIIDTGRERFNQEKVLTHRQPIGAAGDFLRGAREKTIQFLTDPEVKMELFKLPYYLDRKTARARSTYAEYL
jgi:hypothetical protein